MLAFARRHWLITLLIAAGAALRVITVVAYRPAIIYVDTISVYLNHLPGANLPWGDLPTRDPLGYNMLLVQPLLAIGNLTTIIIAQHLMGLGMAVLIYIVLLRRGVWRWLAALAAAPVLLDAYQLEIEHTIMSDTLFETLLVGAFAALLWRRQPGPVAIAVAGLCLGAAATVRVVGAPLIVLFVVYLLIVLPRLPFKLLGSSLAALSFLVPILGYSLYTITEDINFPVGATGANALYGRAATFVDCSTLKMPAAERQLCPKEPLGSRRSPDYYSHDPTAPVYHVYVPAGQTIDGMQRDFADRAMTQQPLGLVAVVLRDSANAFTWNHEADANPDAPTSRWQFQPTFPYYPTAVTSATVTELGAQFGGGPPRSVPLAAAFLREYQLSIGFMPGPATAACLLVALIAVAGTGRRRIPNRMPTAAFLCGALVVIGGADFYEFTWRYQLPGLVLIPLAGALGISTLAWRKPPEPFPTGADHAAADAFDQEYGDDDNDPVLAPVTVVIAAYDEATGIGAVLDAIPATVPGPDGPLDVAALVMVDGATDDTAEVARKHGAYVCAMPTNRGQGAALRLGYYLARSGGARYIVTTDADGQYDVTQLPELLEPIFAGRADFVTGSRRLGVDLSTDQVRRAGVRVFATLVTVLTRHRVTDTSFGFRAMRAEVTADVRLDQPQYQSSELLIAVLARGWRVVERPMTMRPRHKGHSKKGNNLRYGWRYALVVFSTWSRESSSARTKTKRSRSRNLATNVNVYDPK
jgi:Glycosyl transferase family 2